MKYNFSIDPEITEGFEKDYIAVIRRYSKNTDKLLKYPAMFVRINEKGKETLIAGKTEKIFLIPDLEGKMRQFIYLSGMPGAGKSYWCREYIKIYHKLFPDRKIYYFSRQVNESDIEEISKYTKFLAIENFSEIMEEYGGNDELFRDSLMVFDDIVGDDKLQKLVWDFINQTSELYRKINCSVISCNHSATDYRKTSKVIKQCTHYVMFPHSLAERNNRVLSYNYRLTQPQIYRIMDTKSRWVCLDTIKGIIMNDNEIYNI